LSNWRPHGNNNSDIFFFFISIDKLHTPSLGLEFTNQLYRGESVVWAVAHWRQYHLNDNLSLRKYL
jgi:hypothetical protein